MTSRLPFLLRRRCTRCRGSIAGVVELAIEASRRPLGELSHNMTAAPNTTALRSPTLLHQPPLHPLDDAARPHTSGDRQRHCDGENNKAC